MIYLGVRHWFIFKDKTPELSSVDFIAVEWAI